MERHWRRVSISLEIPFIIPGISILFNRGGRPILLGKEGEKSWIGIGAVLGSNRRFMDTLSMGHGFSRVYPERIRGRKPVLALITVVVTKLLC